MYAVLALRYLNILALNHFQLIASKYQRTRWQPIVDREALPGWTINTI